MKDVESTGAPLGTGRDEGPAPQPQDRQDEHDPATPLARLAEADRHLRAIGAEVEALREELTRLRQEAGDRTQLLTERDNEIAELSVLLPTLQQARADAEREAEGVKVDLARAETSVSELRSYLVELESRLAEEHALAQRQAEEATAEVRVSETPLSRETERAAALEAQPARARSGQLDTKALPAGALHPAATSAHTHLRFVAQGGGYTVSQWDGEAPQGGEVVELGGARFVVSKTGPSPFPSDTRRCAYLLAEGPHQPG